MAIVEHRNGTASPQVRLTAAEARILELLPTYLTLDAIAESLGRSRSTVKTHVAHIYKKLGVSTRGEAVERACETGLLPDPGIGTLLEERQDV